MEIDGNLLRCSFCGRSQWQVAKLIAGPGGLLICDGCVALARRWPIVEEPRPRCGFCELPRDPVRAPASGGPAAVCAGCLELCEEIIAEEAEGG